MSQVLFYLHAIMFMFSHFIGATDIWQPVDAGYGFIMKKLTAQAQNRWLEEDNIETGIANIDLWLGNCEKKLTCSDRRILITEWVGNAVDTLNHSNYDNFRWRCFEKTGILITADGSEDEKIQPEGSAQVGLELATESGDWKCGADDRVWTLASVGTS